MSLTSVLEVLRRRTDLTVEALAQLGDDDLLRPSELPDWSVLTIACHLRYGASALLQMTDDALAGRPASYYPDGRATQRPGTLHPADGETPRDVVRSMAAAGEALQRRWETLSDADWATDAVEPEDNPDLGAQPLAALPLFRLTEVEVHSTDLGVGIPDWDEAFAITTLPMRIQRLHGRRPTSEVPEGTTWRLATPEDAYRVTIEDGAASTAIDPSLDPVDAEVRATPRDLVALLLGRACKQPALWSGNEDVGRSFSILFPGA